jgi:hypothetical protein
MKKVKQSISTARVRQEQYNRELDESIAHIENGQSHTPDEVEKVAKE